MAKKTTTLMIDIHNEFRILGININDPIPQAILRMVDIHRQQGHSEFSHRITMERFSAKAEEMASCFISRKSKIRYVKEDIEIWTDSFDDEKDKQICREVKSLLEVLVDVESEDIISCIDWCLQLMKGLPISPLTGEDDEWIEYEPGKFKNKRCSAIFKGYNKAYFFDAVVFMDKDTGNLFTGNIIVDGNIYFSCQYISFPYEPAKHYVEVEKVHPENLGSNKYRFVNPEQARAVFESFK